MDKSGKTKIAIYSLIAVAIISIVTYAVFVLAAHDASANVEPKFVAKNSLHTFNFDVKKTSGDNIIQIEIRKTSVGGTSFSITQDFNLLDCPLDWSRRVEENLVRCTWPAVGGTPITEGTVKFPATAPSPQEDTGYIWSITTTDTSGGTSNTQATITTVDVTQPTTTITCNGIACQDTWYNSDVNIGLNCNDASSGCTSDSPKYCVDQTNTCIPNTKFTGTFAISSEGKNFIIFSSMDNVGNSESAKSQVVKIDKNPPTIHINSPSAGSWQDSFFDVFFDVTDAGELDTCTLFVNGADKGIINCADKKATINAQAWCSEGENTCSVSIGAKDKAENSASDSTVYSIDFTSPSVGVTGAPLNWQSIDATAGVSCSDGSLSDCQAGSKRLKLINEREVCPKDYSLYSLIPPQTISSHSWVCGAAKDNAENAGFSNPTEFKVDKIKPTIQINNPPAGSWQDSFFDVFFDISDLGGSGFKECSYEVKSLGATTKSKSTFDCGAGKVNIGVNTQDCKNEGNNACIVTFNANDNAGNNADEKSRTFSIDFSMPVTTKTIGSPNFDDGKFVTIKTPITLAATDSVSGVKEICYSINEKSPICIQGNSVTFKFLEESMHSLEFWAVDIAGNKEDPTIQTHFVDDSAPVTTKSFDGVLFVNQIGDEFITPQTKIILTANDPEPEHASGVAKLSYRTYLCGTQAPVVFNEVPGSRVEFKLEESCHVIEYFAADNLGNTEITHKQTVFVDDTKPIASKEVGKPEFLSGGNSFITSQTPITLSCEDQQPHPSGVDEIFFKFYLKGQIPPGFQSYDGQFTIPEDSLHIVEFYCTDNLGTKSSTEVREYNVDNKVPLTTKTLEGTSGENNWFISDVMVTLDCADEKSGCKLTEFSINGDGLKTYNPNSKPILTNDGINEFCHQSTDNLGNNDEELSCQNIMVDKTAPTIDKLTPEPDSLAFNNAGGVIISARVCDETSRVDKDSIIFFVDGDLANFDTSPDGENCVEVSTQMHLSEGEHDAKISVEDMAGHSNSAEWSWNVRTKFQLALNKHWNFVSSPLIPNDKNIDVVFNNTKNDVESIWTYDAFTESWQGKQPGCPPDVCELLTTFEDGKGYWINMRNSATLIIEGFRMLQGPFNVPPEYPVKGGAWNMIGFKSMEDMPAETYLASIWNHLQTPNPLPITSRDNVFPISTGIMHSGEGYWLFVKGDDGVIAPPAEFFS